MNNYKSEGTGSAADAIEYGAILNRLLHTTGQHLMQLFPDLSVCSLAEMQRREIQLPTKRYSWCASVFTNRNMSEAVDQLSDLYLNPDFSYQLKAYLYALTGEQKAGYYQIISELIATLDKLNNQLDKATYYTATFDVWAVASDQTSFFNVIAWISEARNWLSDIRPILTNCLPTSYNSETPQQPKDDEETESLPIPKEAKETNKTTLIEWFADPGKYPVVMGLLVDNRYCQPGTYIWVDEANGARTAVAILVKHLHAQGFFIDNVKPKNSEILNIVKYTFGVDMSIDTIKKATLTGNRTFSFIGPATTY